MTSVQGGKYCMHCSKTVTDFTHLGDQEIIKLLKQSSQNLCGRFTDEIRLFNPQLVLNQIPQSRLNIRKVQMRKRNRIIQ